MLVVRARTLLAVIGAILTAGVMSLFAYRAVRTSASTPKDGIDVPILMYHSVLKNSDGNKYIVSPDDFERDLKFLAENGYTTVVMRDLTEYVYEGEALPEKPVVLTFDDGYYNNYLYIYPLLQKYGARAVISIVGSYTDLYTEQKDTHANYAHLSWDTAREMQDSGYVEIQNHTYDFHSYDKGRKGCKKKSGESIEAYTTALVEDIGSMQDKCREKLGVEPTTFTYPFGFVCEESYDIIKALGFRASLSCSEGINRISREAEDLYMLKRCIRTPSRSAEDILKK